MKYLRAQDVEQRIADIVRVLNMQHLDTKRIFCFRSYGTSSKAIARCYGLSKIWQAALQAKPAYIIEVIAERFDNLPIEEQTKVLIHELLHIPKAFGGGFRHHDFVCQRNVEHFYTLYMQLRKSCESLFK
ncbi:MAG: putative metallopeptidase [Candidatus Nanoarchaeia archaeon]